MPPDVDRLLANASWVKALAVRLVGDDAAADDLAQETWLRALERPPRDAATPRSLRAWLKRVVARFALQRERHDRAADAREREVARDEAEPDVAGVVAHAELHRRVVDAVLALDEPYRATLLLRFFEDEAPAQIATRMSVPVKTVHTRLRRGLERLRARFEVERRPGGEMHAWIGAGPSLIAPTMLGRLLAEVVFMSGRIRVAAAVLVVAGLSLVVWRSWPRQPSQSVPLPPNSAVAPVAAASGELPGAAPAGARREADAIATGRSPSLSEINEIVFSGSITATGRVVDAAGSPIGGARIECELPDASRHVAGVEDVVDEEIRAHGFWDAPCASPRVAATTDVLGHFSIKGVRNGLPYGLSITATGFESRRVDLPMGGSLWGARLGSGSEVRLPDVALTRGCNLGVHVVDGRGQDAPSIEIFSGSWPDDGRFLWPNRNRRRGTTGDHGELAFAVDSESVWVFARAMDGRQAIAVDVKRPRADSTEDAAQLVELRLADGKTLKVVVHDSTKHPLPGLRVTLRAPVGRAATVVNAEALTDDAGTASFQGFEPGEKTIYLSAPGGVPILVEKSEFVHVDADTHEVEITYPLTAAPLPVRFVDAIDATPVRATTLLVVDAEVDGPPSGQYGCRDLPTRGIGSLAVDATRGWVLLSRPASHPAGDDRFPREKQSDRFRVIVDARDHARTWLGPFDPAKLSTADPLVLALERGRVIHGSVVDEHGGPIAGARIHEFGSGPGCACNMFTWHVAAPIRAARAESDGNFAIGPLAAGTHALVIDATGFLSKSLAIDVGDDTKPIRVVLDRGFMVDGSVQLEPDDEPGAFAVVLSPRAVHSPDPGTQVTSLDDDGRFHFEAMPPGEFAILALLPSKHGGGTFLDAVRLMGAESKPPTSEVVRFSLSDGARHLDLQPWREPSAYRRLDTQVVDTAKPGAKRAVILYLDTAGLPHRENVKILDGRLALDLLEAKRYLVLLAEDIPASRVANVESDREWYVASVVLNSRDLEQGVAPIHVQRGTVALHVHATNGSTLDAGAKLTVVIFVDNGFSDSFSELHQGTSRSFPLVSDGTVTIPDVPAGRRWIYVTDAANQQRGEIYVNVVPDTTTAAEIPWK